ncbi:molecular chaperone HtpG [uncultured Mailhella sp.]|uniref:molecular chaperone HtpG n=1 Tax=uncultured Mailhella sp. TaxID=1981031 RepID=UPI0025F837C6|nr:molecular chaperone HtpG [uncultured Mailhella sp.]
MAETTHQFRAETCKLLNILTHSLYTNHEIFLRELLSNASDALEKVRFLQTTGAEVRDPELPLEIRITTDKDNHVITVADTGIGMTEQELIDNLGTIARSGSEEFLKAREAEKAAAKPADEEKPAEETKADDEDEEKSINAEEPIVEHDDSKPDDASQIIGRFGIGFYSVFMVAKKVEVTSVSATGDGVPHVWTSDGTGSFTIRTLEGAEAEGVKRGTCIRIFLRDEAHEYEEKFRLEGIIRKHSNFLPFAIQLDGERVNTTAALWREPKFSITKEQYNEFYKFLTYDQKEPLDVIHFSVDAPVQFNCLLYIPGSTVDVFDERKDEWGPDLYVRRVLIDRHNKELLPSYFAFMKGVVDTEDLPLNISRETLQENVVLRKIGQTITRQLLTHFERLAKNDPEKYETIWKLHGKYIKFGFDSYQYRDRVAPLLRYYSTAQEDKFTSLDDYVSRMKPDQKEIWYVAASSMEAAKVNPHLGQFRRKGLEVLYLTDPVDEFALEAIMEYQKHPFKSVELAEAGALDAFPDVENAEPKPEPLSEEQKPELDALISAVKTILGDQVKDVRAATRPIDAAACLVSPDGVTSSMEKLMRVMQKTDGIPQKILELNPDNALVRSLMRICREGAEDDTFKDMVNALFDTTLLLDGYMNEPFAMAERSMRLLRQAAGWYSDLRK